jgi:hypothetical protein
VLRGVQKTAGEDVHARELARSLRVTGAARFWVAAIALAHSDMGNKPEESGKPYYIGSCIAASAASIVVSIGDASGLERIPDVEAGHQSV